MANSKTNHKTDEKEVELANRATLTEEERVKKLKTISNFGSWSVGLGILAPIATAILVIADQKNLQGLKGIADWVTAFGDVYFMILIAVVLIILGQRLKKFPYNEKNGQYILVTTIIAIVTIVLSFLGGGMAGILWFIIAIYGFVAKSAWNKLNQEIDFREKLEAIKFKLGGWFWGMIIGLAVILFGFFFVSGFMEGWNEALAEQGLNPDFSRKEESFEEGITQVQSANWQLYYDEEGGFSYLTPSEVEVERTIESSGGITYVNKQFSSLGTGDEDFYMVQFNQFDIDIEEIDGMLEIFVDAILAEYPNTKQSKAPSNFNGHAALDFDLVENDNGTTYYYKGKAVAIGEKLYLMLGMTEEENSSSVAKFLNSLQIEE